MMNAEPTAPRRPLTRRLKALVAAGVLVVLTPLATIAANPTFSDLGQAAAVHQPNIQAIGNAGITTGFEDPANPGQRTYNPKGLVTREEMASFLARTAGLGGNAPVVNAATAQTVPDGAITTTKISPTGSTAGQVLTSTGTGVSWQTVASGNGAQGPAGPTGATGATGATGPQGVQGPKGDTGAQGVQGPKGDTGAQGTAGIVGLENQQCVAAQYLYGFGAQGQPLCDNRYGPSLRPVYYLGITTSNVRINGATTDVPQVAAGATFTLALHYTFVPDDGGFFQIQVGYANATGFADCTEITGTSAGDPTFTLTAPTTPGTYNIAFDRGQDYGCRVTQTTWAHVAPVPSHYIVTLQVR